MDAHGGRMDRRAFLRKAASCGGMACLAGALAGKGAGVSESGSKGNGFATRGIYFHDGFTVDPERHAPLHWGAAEWRREVEWLAACGINAIEFATMLEFNRIPSTEMERQKIADRLEILDLAHRHGLAFGYILSNTVMSTVPPDEPPAHQLLDRAETLCPREPGNFERTVALQRWYMETYREADYFEEFAADWGGCACGRCGVPEYLRYVAAFSEKAREINAQARVYANTWCISFWGKDPLAEGWRGAFDREIDASREVIAALPELRDNVHLTLPCHHLYRPLAYESYGGRAHTPRFPTEADVASVREAGRELMAWTHFILDDDAYRPAAWGIVHCEGRYIQALVRALRDAGIDRVMGNLYLPYLQLPNTYLYGRLLADPDADVQALLLEFARLIATREDAPALAEALAWMDNESYWERQHPMDARLAPLPVSMTREDAARAVAGVRPNASPELPLPIAPAEWLADLGRSIARMDWAE